MEACWHATLFWANGNSYWLTKPTTHIEVN